MKTPQPLFKYSLSSVLIAVALAMPAAQAGTISWTPTYFNDVGLSAGDFSLFQTTIGTALSFYTSNFSSPNSINVSVEFHAGNTGLGSTSSYYNTIAYQDYRNALAATGETAADALALSFLPNTAANPVNSSSDMDVTLPLLRALGFAEGNLAVPYDSSMVLNTDLMVGALDRSGPVVPGSYDLLQVVYHELNEVLGWASALNGVSNSPITVPSGAISDADLFRFNGAGSRSFTSDPNEAAYFSIDNGSTSLANFNTLDFGDRHDFNGVPSSVQDAASTPGIRLNNGPAELALLDVMGYNPITKTTPPSVPEPSTMLLLGSGLLAGFFRNKKKAAI